MKSYIDRLNEHAEETRKAHQRGQVNVSRGSDPRIVCEKPLTVQIEELMRSLPPAERQRRWTMAEFIARFLGRYTTRPHPMQVGEALRSLGWHQARDWSSEGGGRRYWVNKSDASQ